MVADIVSGPVSKLVNSAFSTSVFPENLKNARVTPVFKKDDKFLKINYQPISILPAFSKIFERIMHDQLSSSVQIQHSTRSNSYDWPME